MEYILYRTFMFGYMVQDMVRFTDRLNPFWIICKHN